MNQTLILTVAVGVFLIAAIGGWLLQKQHPNLESTTIRIFVFGLYFWVLVFAQALIGGLLSLALG